MIENDFALCADCEVAVELSNDQADHDNSSNDTESRAGERSFCELLLKVPLELAAKS